MSRKQFLTIALDICSLLDLTPVDKMVLGRIAGFETYFESSEQCANIFGVKAETIRKSKAKLEKLGYIKSIENTGRGKKYQANPLWKTNKTKKVEIKEKVQTVKPSGFVPSVVPSVAEKKQKFSKEEAFIENYPNLKEPLARAKKYLKEHKIPVTNGGFLRHDLLQVAELFHPDAQERVLLGYFNYLESTAYEYQVAHTKFCPTITQQSDMFGKFSAIRAFSQDKERQYDPSKVLTK